MQQLLVVLYFQIWVLFGFRVQFKTKHVSSSDLSPLQRLLNNSDPTPLQRKLNCCLSPDIITGSGAKTVHGIEVPQKPTFCLFGALFKGCKVGTFSGDLCDTDFPMSLKKIGIRGSCGTGL